METPESPSLGCPEARTCTSASPGGNLTIAGQTPLQVDGETLLARFSRDTRMGKEEAEHDADAPHPCHGLSQMLDSFGHGPAAPSPAPVLHIAKVAICL